MDKDNSKKRSHSDRTGLSPAAKKQNSESNSEKDINPEQSTASSKDLFDTAKLITDIETEYTALTNKPKPELNVANLLTIIGSLITINKDLFNRVENLSKEQGKGIQIITGHTNWVEKSKNTEKIEKAKKNLEAADRTIKLINLELPEPAKTSELRDSIEKFLSSDEIVQNHLKGCNIIPLVKKKVDKDSDKNVEPEKAEKNCDIHKKISFLISCKDTTQKFELINSIRDAKIAESFPFHFPKDLYPHIQKIRNQFKDLKELMIDGKNIDLGKVQIMIRPNASYKSLDIFIKPNSIRKFICVGNCELPKSSNPDSYKIVIRSNYCI